MIMTSSRSFQPKVRNRYSSGGGALSLTTPASSPGVGGTEDHCLWPWRPAVRHPRLWEDRALCRAR
jgi:hypothetical protein